MSLGIALQVDVERHEITPAACSKPAVNAACCPKLAASSTIAHARIGGLHRAQRVERAVGGAIVDINDFGAAGHLIENGRERRLARRDQTPRR